MYLFFKFLKIVNEQNHKFFATFPQSKQNYCNCFVHFPYRFSLSESELSHLSYNTTSLVQWLRHNTKFKVWQDLHDDKWLNLHQLWKKWGQDFVITWMLFIWKLFNQGAQVILSPYFWFLFILPGAEHIRLLFAGNNHRLR